MSTSAVGRRAGATAFQESRERILLREQQRVRASTAFVRKGSNNAVDGHYRYVSKAVHCPARFEKCCVQRMQVYRA